MSAETERDGLAPSPTQRSLSVLGPEIVPQLVTTTLYVIDNAAIDRGVEAFYNQERTKLGWYHAPDERSAMRAALDAARRSPAVCQVCSAPLTPEQIVIATSRGSEAKYCSRRCRQTARARRKRARKTQREP